MVKKEYDALWSIYHKMVNPNIYERICEEVCVELTDYEFSLAKKLMKLDSVLSLRYGDIENKVFSSILPCSLIHSDNKCYIVIFNDLFSQTNNFRIYLDQLKIDFQLNRQRSVKSVFDIENIVYEILQNDNSGGTT